MCTKHLLSFKKSKTRKMALNYGILHNFQSMDSDDPFSRHIFNKFGNDVLCLVSNLHIFCNHFDCLKVFPISYLESNNRNIIGD